MKKDLSGQRFGKLVVLKLTEKSNNNREKLWKCQCDCGKVTEQSTSSLTIRNRISCGCERKGTKKHNQCTREKRSLAYISWGNMMQRCYNKNYTYYKHYGGRGIKVCRKWWKFKNFYKDMGDRPNNMTLERKDNEKGYYPSNCKWATMKEQAQNKRKRGK